VPSSSEYCENIMKYAWVRDNTVVDTCVDDPKTIFHKDVAENYNVMIANEIGTGATLVDDEWQNIQIQQTHDEEDRYMLSPIEFKLCFTPQERVAIKAASETDAILQDAYSLMDDQRLTFVNMHTRSVIELIDYLESCGLITQDRAIDIKSGKIL